MITKEQYISEMTPLILKEGVTDDNCLRKYLSQDKLQERVLNEFKAGVHGSGIKDFTGVSCSFNSTGFAGFIKDNEYIYSYGLGA